MAKMPEEAKKKATATNLIKTQIVMCYAIASAEGYSSACYIDLNI